MGFVYLAIGIGLASTLEVSCWTITGQRQAARIRALYLKAILRQDIAFFDMEMSTGQVVERMSADTLLVQDAIGEKVGKTIQLLSTCVGGFAIAFVRGWYLALVMLSSIPPVAIAFACVSIFRARLSSRMQAKYGDAANVVEQTLGAIRMVVSFNGEKQAITTYNKFIRKAYELALQEGVVNGLASGFLDAALCCSYGLAIWYGSGLIVNHEYNGGMVVSVIMDVMMGAISLGQATPSVTASAEGQGAAYRMFKTIERKPDIDIYDTTGIILEDIKGDVELKDVYFSYPSRSKHLVFHGLSLRVASGTTMALVGESGSGKSTVISLVERFYDPLAGEVLIDGVDIRRMKLGWIRQNIGLVSQEPVLFSTTIRENIAYGMENLTHEEIKRAIELANAAKFIDKFPDGLDTVVGERGIQLSGGQKQRIAIARAIVKNPKILLLDEATSALDMESETVIQVALNQVMLERTTIIVAHRLTTVKNADVISVLQHGNVVEQGSHLELMQIPEGGKLVEPVRSMTFQSIMRQEINWFDKPEHSSGSIGARLSTDALIVKRLVGDTLLFNIQTISTIILAFTIAMVANWKLALIITVVVPLVGFQSFAQMKLLVGLNRKAKLKYEEASQLATDVVDGIRTVAALCAEKNVMEMYDKKCESPIREGIREGVVGGLGFGFSFLVLATAARASLRVMCLV